MNKYQIDWLIWIAVFFVIEVPALIYHRGQGDSLSECTWKVFAITGKQHRFWRIRRVALVAFLGWMALHLLSGGAFAQVYPDVSTATVKPTPNLRPASPPEMFHLENPGNLPYSESEALRAYYDAVSAVEQQYRLLDTPTPYFTLRLGAENVPGVRFPASKSWTGGEICLPKWDVSYFREGVIALAINELLRPENIARLEKHIEDVHNATIGVEELKH